MIPWASLEELGAAYGLGIGAGLLLGGLVAFFNSWRA